MNTPLQTDWRHKILFLILIVLGLWLLFGEVLWSPNSTMMTIGGDGFKNYFTYYYAIMYDEGVHFSGMNYPYGEHMVFADSMPLMVWCVRLLNDIIPGNNAYSLGIMHYSLILSIVICSIYIYKIQRMFGVSTTWSIVAAVIITFLSPQIFRIFGHFGMGYLFFLPFCIYQLMRYNQCPSWSRILKLCIVGAVVSFLHLYNMALMAFLIIAYILSSGLFQIQSKAWMPWIKKALPLLLVIVVLFGIVQTFMTMTDTVTDRPAYPYGIFGGANHGDDILTADIPLGRVLGFAFGGVKELGHSEGLLYLGWAAIISGLYFVYAFFKRFKTKRSDWHLATDYNLWILVGVIHLLFGMGVPLVWAKEFFAEALPFLRQFRSIGRFSWAFYYIFLIYTSIVCFRYFTILKSRNKTILSYVFLTILVAVSIIQTAGYLQNWNKTFITEAASVHEKIFDNNESKNLEAILNDNGQSLDDFQAILGLPFFHIGSEKLWIQEVGEGKTMWEGGSISMLTGLPLINVMMSRTSWSSTFELVQIVDGVWNEKTILQQFDSRPILLMVNSQQTLSHKDNDWMEVAQLIKKDDYRKINFYSVDIKKLIENNKQYRAKALQKINASTDPIGLLSAYSNAFYYYNGFENTPSKIAMRGSGAIENKSGLSKPQIIDTIFLENVDTSRTYMLSMWIKCNNYNYKTTDIQFDFYDKNQQLIHTEESASVMSTNIQNFWFLNEKSFRFPAQTHYMVIMTNDKNSKIGRFIAVDDIMIYPIDAPIYVKSNGQTIVNNRLQKND